MSFKKSFFKNISSLALYTYIQQGIEFFSTVILSRILLPDEYGFVTIIYLFSGFFQLFANAGIGQSLIRSDYGSTFHRHLFSLSMWIGISLAALLCIMAYPIAYFFNDMRLVLPTIIVSLYFVFDSINFIPHALLAKQLNFKIIGISRVAGTAFTIALTILLAYLGMSYWALIIPGICNPLIQYYILRKNSKFPLVIYSYKAAFRTLKKIKSLFGNLTLQNIVSYWGKNLDKMLIGKSYTMADLGLYNRAFRFIELNYKLISGIFSSVLFPSLKKLQSTNGDINKEYLDILGVTTLINYPLALILIAIPSELVYVLWGNNWMQVATYLPYIGIIIIFQTILSTMNPVFMLYGKEGKSSIITVFTSVFNATAIAIGAFFSMKMIIILYTCSIVLFIVPINIYFGFYKAFCVPVKQLLSFWLLKLVLVIVMLFSIIFEYREITLVTLLVFLVHLLFSQKKYLFLYTI
ncbi:MAG: oligosaccharide flippase family protein [Bacteroidales bacterium]|nr:oligosaccharide flippase family protein [Bacteroidales bacterium]